VVFSVAVEKSLDSLTRNWDKRNMTTPTALSAKSKKFAKSFEGKTLEDVKWDATNAMTLKFTDGTQLVVWGETRHIGRGQLLGQLEVSNSL
jgi:hypothetical protein